MTEAELFKHYEKLYFQEQQRKEQIFSRLSIPLAVIVALVGFYSVIIAMDYKKLEVVAAFAFGFFGSLSAGLLLVAVIGFADALLGRMDNAPETPNKLEEWRRELQAYYADEPDSELLVAASIRSAMYADYMNCASLMMVNNDLKASSLYFCNMALLCATPTALVAYAIAKFPSL
ncbi:hypothetical protein [Pseudomonas tolaasii]|uniref:hypothetical protein n=1 Tax=Pseudomonas tolaasii TaxID=29442 RepID=UPI0015A2674B|nr:hypothetical protein [Pseudomonas tolaasii]NVZ43720.1 hypothetical protein [Pseudomonas tolaasii]NWA49378.1 hypothetical protein [Pseudomonas tolaasii]